MAEKRPNNRRRTPRKIDASYLENAALYYLQRYATSSQNLKTVLMRKIRRSCAYNGNDAAEFLPVVDKLVARYIEVGLLDDRVYTEGRVTALRRQGLSRQAIQQKMMQKGLSAEDIAAAVARIDAALGSADEDHEFIAARTLARRKRIGPWRRQPLEDPKAAQKEMAVMARNGFSYDVARRALEATHDDLED